jgi:hypothetical protein
MPGVTRYVKIDFHLICRKRSTAFQIDANHMASSLSPYPLSARGRRRRIRRRTSPHSRNSGPSAWRPARRRLPPLGGALGLLEAQYALGAPDQIPGTGCLEKRGRKSCAPQDYRVVVRSPALGRRRYDLFSRLHRISEFSAGGAADEAASPTSGGAFLPSRL